MTYSFSNGGFETGDFTGWYASAYYYYGDADGVVTAATKHDGNYGAYLYITSGSPDDTTVSYLTVDPVIPAGSLKAGDIIEFWYNVPTYDLTGDGTPWCTISLYCADTYDDLQMKWIDTTTSGWAHVLYEIPTGYDTTLANYTWEVLCYIRVQGGSTGSWDIHVYVDSFNVLEGPDIASVDVYDVAVRGDYNVDLGDAATFLEETPPDVTTYTSPEIAEEYWYAYTAATVYISASIDEFLFSCEAATTTVVSPLIAPPVVFLGELTEYDLTEDGLSVGKTINDVLWGAEGSIRGIVSTPAWKNFSITLTDHTGASNLLFYGPVTGSEYNYDVADESCSFHGYDYGYYLSKQNIRWQHIGPWNYIYPGWPRPTPPDTLSATEYEHPQVSEITAPSEIIMRLLGNNPHGTEWQNETGIEPYVIREVSGWGTTIPYKWFNLNDDANKYDAIKEICDHCHMIFLIHPVYLPAFKEYSLRAYFVNEDEIDTYLPIPAAVTFTKDSTDGTLLRPIKVIDNQDDIINLVIVHGQNVGEYGVWDVASVGTDAVNNNEELERIYYIRDPYFEDSTVCQQIATTLLSILGTSTKIYHFKFWKRFDLRLYQKIRFVGWNEDFLPSEWMRIVGITYNHSKVEDIVDVQAVTDADFSSMAIKRRVAGSELTEIEQMVQKLIGINVLENATGEVLEVDEVTGTAIVQLDRDGRRITVKLLD